MTIEFSQIETPPPQFLTLIFFRLMDLEPVNISKISFLKILSGLRVFFVFFLFFFCFFLVLFLFFTHTQYTLHTRYSRQVKIDNQTNESIQFFTFH